MYFLPTVDKKNVTSPTGRAVVKPSSPAGPVTLERLLEGFSEGPLRVQAEIVDLLNQDRAGFADSTIKVLRGGRIGQGQRFLLARLIDSGLFVELLCDRSRVSGPEAIELLRIAIALDPHFDVKLTRWLLEDGERTLAATLGARSEVLLDILCDASPGNRLLPMLVQFLRAKGARVRSKAVLILAQRSQRAELGLVDHDPRVRANAVEALWGIDTAKVRRILLTAKADANNRVAGNALLGLLLLGDRSVTTDVRAMLRHAVPPFRATGAWVVGQAKDRVFIPDLEVLKGDPDERVRVAAEDALAQFVGAEHHQDRRQVLPVKILRLRETEKGRKRLWILPKFVAGVTDTVFTPAVLDHSRTVEGVHLKPLDRGSLALGFLVPQGWSDGVHSAVRRILSARREGDRAAILRYKTNSAGGQAAVGGCAPVRGFTMTSTAPRPAAAQKANYSLTPNLPSRASAKDTVQNDIFAALSALLAVPTSLCSHVGIIVFATDPSVYEAELDSSTIDELLQLSDAQGAFIHAIAHAKLPPTGERLLRVLCGETSGLLLRAASDADIPHLGETLYSALTEGYEITYRAETEGTPFAVDLELSSATSIGKARLDVSSEGYLSRHGDRVWYS